MPVARCQDLRIGGKPSTARSGEDQVWSQADHQSVIRSADGEVSRRLSYETHLFLWQAGHDDDADFLFIAGSSSPPQVRLHDRAGCSSEA